MAGVKRKTLRPPPRPNMPTSGSTLTVGVATKNCPVPHARVVRACAHACASLPPLSSVRVPVRVGALLSAGAPQDPAPAPPAAFWRVAHVIPRAFSLLVFKLRFINIAHVLPCGLRGTLLGGIRLTLHCACCGAGMCRCTGGASQARAGSGPGVSVVRGFAFVLAVSALVVLVLVGWLKDEAAETQAFREVMFLISNTSGSSCFELPAATLLPHASR